MHKVKEILLGTSERQEAESASLQYISHLNETREIALSQIQRLEDLSEIRESFFEMVRDDTSLPDIIAFDSVSSVQERVFGHARDGINRSYFIRNNSNGDETMKVFTVLSTPDSPSKQYIDPQSPEFVGFDQAIELFERWESDMYNRENPTPELKVITVDPEKKSSLSIQQISSIVDTISFLLENSTDSPELHSHISDLQSKLQFHFERRSSITEYAEHNIQLRLQQFFHTLKPYLKKWGLPYLLINDSLVIERETGELRILPPNSQPPTQSEYTDFRANTPRLQKEDCLYGSNIVFLYFKTTNIRKIGK